MPLLKKPVASRLLPGASFETPPQSSASEQSSGDGESKPSDLEKTDKKPKGWLVAIAREDNILSSAGNEAQSQDAVDDNVDRLSSQSSTSATQELPDSSRRNSQGWLLARAEEQERLSLSQKSSESISQSDVNSSSTTPGPNVPASKSGEAGWLVSFAKSLDNRARPSSSSSGQEQNRRMSFPLSQTKESSQASSSSRGRSPDNKRSSLSSFELLASQEILSQVSNLDHNLNYEEGKDASSTNVDVHESVPMAVLSQSAKSNKRPKDEGTKTTAPKSKKSKMTSNEMVNGTSSVAGNLQLKQKTKKATGSSKGHGKTVCPPKTSTDPPSAAIDVNKILLCLEPLPKHSLESATAISAPPVPLLTTEPTVTSEESSSSTEAVTQDVSELVEVLLSQVVENSKSGQLNSVVVTKKSKTVKKPKKKASNPPIFYGDEEDDYFVETEVVDVNLLKQKKVKDVSQESDQSFSVPVPKKRKIAKKPKTVNTKVYSFE